MTKRLSIASGVFVPESGFHFTASRASGPGGQNVNKVASKVDLRVDLDAIVGLDAAARDRLRQLAGSRLDGAGWLQVVRQDTRDQARNFELACEAVRALVAQALVVPKRRRKTRPTGGAVRRRLEAKRQTSERKRSRRIPSSGE